MKKISKADNILEILTFFFFIEILDFRIYVKNYEYIKNKKHKKRLRKPNIRFTLTDYCRSQFLINNFIKHLEAGNLF